MSKNHRCVIAIRVTERDRAAFETLAYQVAQLTAGCVKNGSKVTDIIVTFGTIKELIRDVKHLDAKKRFDTLLVYSPTQIAKSKREYDTFASTLKEFYNIDTVFLRPPN